MLDPQIFVFDNTLIQFFFTSVNYAVVYFLSILLLIFSQS